MPPPYDIWIYYRSQIKDIILEIGKWYLPRHPRLPIVSASPVYGIPRILQCTCGLSPGVPREIVPQVISVPYDPSSVEYEAKPNVDATMRNKVTQEGVHRNASSAESNHLLLSCSAIRYGLILLKLPFFFARTFRRGGEYVVGHTSQYCNSCYGGYI